VVRDEEEEDEEERDPFLRVTWSPEPHEVRSPVPLDEGFWTLLKKKRSKGG